MTATTTSTAHIEALHHWPDAPPHRAYLAHPHRHVFGLAVTVQPTHSDRDIEFHDLADDLYHAAEQLSAPYHPATRLRDFGPASCEDLASDIADLLTGKGYDVLRVTVTEDTEHTGEWRT